jgi:hypothetical protein
VATEFCPFLDVPEIHTFKIQPVASWDSEALGMTATVSTRKYDDGVGRRRREREDET